VLLGGRPLVEEDERGFRPKPLQELQTTQRVADHSKTPPPVASDDQPENCPAPMPEDTKGRSRRALAYQSQITGLPPGLDVPLNGVRFDGCDEATNRMIEAKGLGMEWMLKWPEDKLYRSKFYTKMMGQAARQNSASAGRGVDYYFASKKMADFFDLQFARKEYNNILVHHVEAIVKKMEIWLRSLIRDFHNIGNMGRIQLDNRR
jgi:hypothetical protein